MKIQTTVIFEYKLADDEVEQFRQRVLERLEEENIITLNDIPIAEIEEYLSNKLPDAIEETKQGYDRGIVFDDYFGTISLDYCAEGVSDMVHECAQKYENRGRN